MTLIGREVKAQLLEREGRLPDALLACVGGGSNAMGLFYDFIPDKTVRLIGVEAAGRGIDTPETAATIACGSEGIFHGMKSLFLQDQYGQIAISWNNFQRIITPAETFVYYPYFT